MNATALNSSDTVKDVIGHRVLAGIQLINISRLSTHAVPIVSGGLVTVAGQGPKDSNGAGKSSFIAAISLLAGDEQWKWGNGAAGACGLLFAAEGAAQDGQYSDVDHGYIVGVFIDPNADTDEELHPSTVTVWVRINRRPPYIDLRWHEGLHISTGPNEETRATRADDLWTRLPRRGHRDDIHAGRFNETMYGNHVRCVSFLSTSVRQSKTPNLLAQDLNTLDPDRIFDAIAALTGQDRELDKERQYRSDEHELRGKKQEIENDIEQWEAEASVIEEGIKRRENARGCLIKAQVLWKGRCATWVSQAYNRDEEIHDRVKWLHEDYVNKGERLQELDGDIKLLRDDRQFDDYCQAVDDEWERVQTKDREYDLEIQRINGDIERNTNRRDKLQPRVHAADSRDFDTAQRELVDAKEEFENAIAKQGAVKSERDRAQEALRLAEHGHDIAADVLGLLRDKGIHAMALMDLVAVEPAQRDVWEPRLALYKEAVVVPHSEASRARQATAHAPGTLLIIADPEDQHSPQAFDQFPTSREPQLSLGHFMRTLEFRAAKETCDVDVEAGVVIIGSFPEPLTGRAARIAKATQLMETASAAMSKADKEVAHRRAVRDQAERRVEAAQAAEEVASLNGQIDALRGRRDNLVAAHGEFQPHYEDAQKKHRQMVEKRATRDTTLKEMLAKKEELDNFRGKNVEERADLQREQLKLDLPARLKLFGGRHPDDAEHYLADLADEDQKLWDVSQWTLETTEAIMQVWHDCFPRGTPDEEIPAELLALRPAVQWTGTRDQQPVEDTHPALLSAFHTYLAGREQHDKYQSDQLSEQRTERMSSLSAAQTGLQEAALAAQTHRASVAHGIRARLKEVSDNFNRLDLEYGGYGAALEYPEPEPPTDPSKPWRWTVTPKWKRAEGQRFASYRLKSNTAQMEDKAVKLVCAAALTGGTDRPLLLILDELGRNLGKQHRYEAVSLFERIARDRRITVIGALQDDMERYAIRSSALFIKLRRDSDSKAYNDPPTIVGHDDNAARVTLLKDWLTTGHIPHARTTQEASAR